MAGTNTLTDKAIQAALKAAAADGVTRRLSDGDGLRLDVQPTRVGWWRLRYRFQGREGMLSLGTYPEVPLSDARERRDEARRLIAADINPSEKRQEDKAAQRRAAEVQRLAAAGLPLPGTFEHAAREWHARNVPNWTSGHAGKVLAMLERDLLPYLGQRPPAA